MEFKLKVLDLFSGIGGFSLGLESTGGFETVAFCEKDEYARLVLAKHWPKLPIYEDIFDLKGEDIVKKHGTIDLICGGFPCQPFSVAGKQRGTEDDRHLWPEMLRVIKEVKPRWVLAENVAGFVNMALDQVLFDLEGAGYETGTFVIPAASKEAIHKRERVWVFGCARIHTPTTDTDGERWCRRYGEDGSEDEKWEGCEGECGFFMQSQRCNTIYDKKLHSIVTNRNLPSLSWSGSIKQPADLCNRLDLPKPIIHRGDDGVSRRMDRLKCIGNAVVPQVVAELGEAILKTENEFNERL